MARFRKKTPEEVLSARQTLPPVLFAIGQLPQPSADSFIIFDQTKEEFVAATLGGGLAIGGSGDIVTVDSTLTDGDYGDIEISGSGTVMTVESASFPFNAFSIKDSDDSNFLTVQWAEDDTSNQTLSLAVNGSSRSINLVGDLTVVSAASISNTNTGDQTSIVGITGTLAEFNTALTDADFATGGGTVTGTSSGTNTGDQNLSTLVVKANNLSDLTNASTARTNLGLASGTYTPTVSGARPNLDSVPTLTEAQYMQIGTIVTVSGRFNADATVAAVATSFQISLPVASNIGAVEDVAGVAFCGNVAGMGASIEGDVANNVAKIFWVASDVASQDWSYTYSYQII